MNRREFHFVEGKSSKFWAVAVSDATLTVQFGKIGTAGQTQGKAFASPAKARAEAEKLIAEKTRKGYTEVTAASPDSAPPPPAAAPAPAGPAERRIRLVPADWFRARWRGHPEPSPRPAPRPFDFTGLVGQLLAGDSYSFFDAWNAMGVPENISPEEGRFWWHVRSHFDSTPRKRQKFLTGLKPGDCVAPTYEAAQKAIYYDNQAPYAWPLLRALAGSLAPADWMRLLCCLTMNMASAYGTRETAGWCEANLWPAWGEADRAAVREALSRRINGEDASYPDVFNGPCPSWYTARVRRVAAGLALRFGGMDEVAVRFIEGWAGEARDESYSPEDAMELALEAPDAATAERLVRTFGLLPSNPDQARAWLAHTEHAALDVLAAGVLAAGRVSDQVALLDVLMLAESAEAARALMTVKAEAKANKLIAKVVAWLEKHPAHAVAGLTSLAAEKSKAGREAMAWLEAHSRRGQPPAPSVLPPAGPAGPAPAAPPAPPRHIDLPPAERPWGPADPLPAAEPRAFAPEAIKAATATWGDTTAAIRGLRGVSPQEARFWLRCFACYSLPMTQEDCFKEIRRLKPNVAADPIPLNRLKKICTDFMYWECGPLLIRLQASWMDPGDLVELIAVNPSVRLQAVQAVEMAGWLEADVFPRLDAAGLEAVRARLRALLAGDDAEVAHVAAVVGRNAGVEADLEAWARRLKKAKAGWATALFGLTDRATLVREARRLGARLVTPDEAKVWLGLTGHDGLDVLADSVLGAKKAADQLALLDVLLRAQSPEAAVALVTVKLSAKAPEAASRIDRWMKAHPGQAAAGLTPLTAEATPLGEAARAVLGAPPAAAGDPGDALAEVTPARNLPPFADPAVLPPLPGVDAARLLTALKASTLTGPHPAVAALRRGGARPALAAFVWGLFEGWLAAGAPSKDRWALLALGHLGDDGTVLRLTPLIRAWPGESQHQRAVTGLEILRTIGTDAALMALNGMALKLKFKALQDRAREMMDLIAADRGLTREQLEDRIVPDLGLDADGTRVFDFGTRRFHFAFADDLSPAITDETGKLLKELPKPGPKDDAEKAAEAATEWKQLKAQLREAMKVQVPRLEEAMVTGRSWTGEEFRTLLVAHPLMGLLARRLVWEGAAPFRVDGTGAAVSHDGRPVEVGGSVRVAHRLRLTPGQVGSWRAALDGLHVEPPFPQLERTVFAPADAAATACQTPAGAIASARIRGTLEGRGWRRLMHDQGGITGFSKAYPAAGVTAVAFTEETILIGMMDDSERNGVRESYFVAGTGHPHGPCSDEFSERLPRLALGAVDPVAYSETVRDLMSLAPPGK